MKGSRQPWISRSLLKIRTRENLQGRLLACFAACLLPMALPWVMRLVPSPIGVKYFLIADLYVLGVSVPMTALSFVATVFVTDPMQVRLAGYFLKLQEKPQKMPSPLTVCDCFGQDYWRQMRGMLLRAVYVGALMAPFLIAAFLMPGAVTTEVVEGLECVRLDIHPALLLLASLAMLYGSLTTCLVRYVLAEEGATAREALRRSRRLVHGRLLETLVLELSFYPWMLLTAMLVIPAVFVYPYYEGTFAAYYRAITRPQTLQRPHLDGGPEDEDAA